ncbi:hypothetical protein CONLIGDRAFT_570335 [Coniochaeta ligniaria NRRL 30616]|uniref:RRM domain-containing protein n=1 Tax=Coniochaeta ligniaria NRRL 30616 TaxID=1408157 RepID=A0A1J7JKP4_9PEZI|nr:hypothetical protein CONLIGDRAFT_570335 [Coniochaeta ligniaria NRRL 30616]
MTQPREAAFNPSSPHSSTGNADSYKNEGTPDTRLTAFSPEEGSARSSKYYNSLTLTASDPQPLRYPGKLVNSFRPSLAQADKDPFTSQSSAKRDQRLSPLASDFQPLSSFGTPLQLGNSTFQRNDGSFDANRALFRSPTSLTGGTRNAFTRYIVVASSGDLSLTPSDVDALFSHLESLGKRFKGKRYIHSNGNKVYVRFTNLQDAYMVFTNAHHGGPDWRVDFVRPEVWQLFSPGSNADLATEGQVMVIVDIGRNCLVNSADMECYLYRLLALEAEIYEFVKQADSSPILMRILVEYYEVEAAIIAINKYNGFAPPGEDFTLRLSHNKHGAGSSHVEGAAELSTPSVRRNSLSDISSAFQNMSLVNPSQPMGNLIAGGRSGIGNMTMPLAPQVGMYPHPLMYHNQTPASTHYLVDPFASHPPTPYHLPTNLTTFSPLYQPTSPGPLVSYQPGYSTPKSLGFNRPDARRQNAQRVNRSPYYNAAGNHNHVEISRIRDGIDVRTTIMLRNIPNKVDQAMLKRIIDESSWGKYDFMYLRIDFANDCNVGYAFINFVDPLDIIDFVEARDHQRWNCFKSDKVAEISYATIQGKDCLVQKFRNSSVMLEAPHYRPKLYFTTNGPRPEFAGQEEPFPGPDNQSKMKRSCENAEHVGLFTPNAGQHFRDEQRRRRSQYDRGTRLAALEEYDYDNNFKHFPGQ